MADNRSVSSKINPRVAWWVAFGLAVAVVVGSAALLLSEATSEDEFDSQRLYLKLVGRIGPHKAGYAVVMFPVVAVVLSLLFEGLALKANIFAGIALVLRRRWPMSCVNPTVLPRVALERWQPYPMNRGPNR